MAAPELRLNVTLDLAAFRAQLTLLTQEAGARNFGVKLSIDETDFKKQLKDLEKIEPILKINDAQIIAAKDRVKTLNRNLYALRKATATPIEIKVKYVEVNKPPSGATEQIGRAVSGGVRGSQVVESFRRAQLQNTRKAMLEAKMSVGEITGDLRKATDEEFRKSIVQGFTNSGQEAVNGFAAGLKNASSKIAQAAAGIGEVGVRGIKDALGIASPSKVFQQIGEFSVDGLKIGFSDGLKSFKSKAIAEIKAIVAPLKLEFAKIQDITGAGVGPTVGSLRQQLVGNRAYSAPIGPLPLGSEAPYARGDRGQFGYSGYEPRMVSRLRGTPPTADPNSFLQFSRNAAQVQPLPGTQGSFRGFSQSAAQVQRAAFGGGGGGGVPPGGGNVPPGGSGGNPPIPPKKTEYIISFKTNASEISKEIKRVQDEIFKTVRADKTEIKLTLDASKLSAAISTSFKKLDKEIAKAQKQLNKLQIGGSDFRAKAEIVGFKEGQRERGENISNAIRLKAQAGAFEPGSLMRDQKVLEAMRLEASQIRPATKEWINLQQQIAQANLELQKTDQLAENIQLTQTLGALDPKSLNGLETKLTILKNKAKDIAPDTREWKALNKEIQNIEGSIAKATKPRMGGKERLGAAGGAFLYGGGLSGGAGSALGGIGGGLIGGVPGAFTGAAIGQAVDDVGKMTAAMTEQATVIKKLKLGLASASNDFGDFAAANQEVERISNSLLIPLEDVYRKFTQLRASTVALGIDTKTTGQMFEGTAVAVLKAGGSMDDVDGAMRAVVQVFSKGKLTAEELRGQLAERLPGAVVEFAKSAGMSVQELDKAFEAGTTSIEQFIVFLKGKSKEGAAFVKEMETSSEYAGARMSKQFEQLKITIGQAFQPSGAAFQDFVTSMIRGSDMMIAKLIQIKLLQPGSDFYEAEAIAQGAAGPGNLENKLLQAMEDQRKVEESLNKSGAGFMKGVTKAYTDATDKVDIYGKALENIRKQENLTKKREKNEKTGVLDEEQKKRASTFLDVIERREESLIQAREQHEEDISNIRQDAIKQVQDLEKKYQDQRLQAERDLGRVRRDLVSAQQEAGFLDREANAALTGEDPGAIDAARKGAEIVRNYTEKKISIEQTAQDRQIGLSQDLENFKRINADAINKANERYAKNIGEIQKNYAKSVAKLIEEGSGNGAKRLAAAGKLVNALLNQATAQKGVSDIAPGGIQRSGQEFFMGGKLESVEATLTRAKGFSSALYAQVYAYIKATSDIDKATKELGSNLSVTAQPSAVTSTTVSTADLEGKVKQAQVPLKQMGKETDNTNNKLNEQQTLFNAIAEKINGITSQSSNNLTQITTANELTKERLELIRQGVLPALAEEAAALALNNKLEKGRAKKLIDEILKSKLFPKDIYSLQKKLSGRIDANTAETKVAQQIARDREASLTTATLRTQASFEGAGLKAGFTGEAATVYQQQLMSAVSPKEAEEMARATDALRVKREAVQAIETSILSLGTSFSSVFKGMVNQTMTNQQALDTLQQGFASFFRSIGDYFLDMVLRMIADAAKMQIVQGLQSIFSMFGPKIPGAGKLSDLNAPATINNPLGVMDAKANGGIWTGGFTAFANGGMVAGPTLGLVGEGRYNEAIIPLPDGKSVPVQLAGGTEGATAPINTNIVVNVKNGQADNQVTGNQGNQLGREIEGAVRQVILKESRPGGLIYGSR
jgi:tape measure domain-containing protein